MTDQCKCQNCRCTPENACGATCKCNTATKTCACGADCKCGPACACTPEATRQKT